MENGLRGPAGAAPPPSPHGVQLESRDQAHSCPPALPGARSAPCPHPPQNPTTSMFRNRFWSRSSYQLCAEKSRERAISHHPDPQHPGYTRPDSLVTLPHGPASPVRLSRVRCPWGQWPCSPRAFSSQKLPAALGPALFGGAESPSEPLGYNGQAVYQASQLAEAPGADTASSERCSGLHSSTGGGHQPCPPRDGKALTHWCGPRLPPP